MKQNLLWEILLLQIFFALGGGKESKYDKRIIFFDYLQRLYLSRNEITVTTGNAFILDPFRITR